MSILKIQKFPLGMLILLKMFLKKTSLDSSAKIFLILYTRFENSTTHIAIDAKACGFLVQKKLNYFRTHKTRFSGPVAPTQTQ